MTIEEIGRVRDLASEYLSMWFGFSTTAMAKRTPEWIDAAAKRLDGKFSTCCECGEDYPAKEHRIDGEVFCAKCRPMWETKK
jgi:hypothetical protein